MMNDQSKDAPATARPFNRPGEPGDGPLGLDGPG
jgi:hypothetical protein